MKICKIGIHKYITKGTQTVSGVIGGFSETQLQREVFVCKCGKVKYVGFDIATTAHLDKTLDWKPNVL